MTRPLVLAACLGMFAIILGGCGAPVAGTPGPASATATATATSAAPVPSVDAPAGPVTPTGTTLPIGKAATVNYATVAFATGSAAKETTPLEVTVTSIRQGAIGDLSNIDLDAQTKQGDPSYVTVSFRNVGSTPLDPGGIFGLIKAYNSADETLTGLTVIGDFKKCEGIPPHALAAGQSFTNCKVYMAPKGQTASKIVFAFYVGDDRTEITWTA